MTMTTLATIALFASLTAAAQEPTPPKPAPGAAKPTVTLRAAGSDLLLEPMQALAEAYGKLVPTVGIAVHGGGSSVGVAGMKDGSVQLAFTTRQLKPEELAAIRARGFEPIEQVLGYESLAIIVHEDNPIPSLTMAQLTALWSAAAKAPDWAQLGVKLSDGATDVALCGPPTNAGLQATFASLRLAPGGQLRDSVRAPGNSKDVRDFVAKTPNALGYVLAAYADDRVRIVPIAVKPDSKPVLPTATDGSYPLQRASYLYFHDDVAGTAKAFAAWLTKPAAAAVLTKHGIQPKPQR